MSMAENEGGEGGSEEKMDVDDKDQDYSEVGCIIIGFGVTGLWVFGGIDFFLFRQTNFCEFHF